MDDSRYLVWCGFIIDIESKWMFFNDLNRGWDLRWGAEALYQVAKRSTARTRQETGPLFQRRRVVFFFGSTWWKPSDDISPIIWWYLWILRRIAGVDSVLKTRFGCIFQARDLGFLHQDQTVHLEI